MTALSSTNQMGTDIKYKLLADGEDSTWRMHAKVRQKLARLIGNKCNGVSAYPNYRNHILENSIRAKGSSNAILKKANSDIFAHQAANKVNRVKRS